MPVRRSSPRGRRRAGRGRGRPRRQGPGPPRLADIEVAAQQRILAYDRAGDGHYDTVSAFIKSLRGNDPDAALYWLAAMIAAGEDPRFIARRLIIARPRTSATPIRAPSRSPSPRRGARWIGLPEAQYALAQATIYIATAPKSNRSGGRTARRWPTSSANGSLPVPIHLRTRRHRRMKTHGIGVGYRFPHDYEGDDIEQQYLPDELVGRRYYVPGDQGYEATIGARMEARAQARAERPRKKQRAEPPMAGMSDAIRPREENRKKLAETQKKDAAG